MRSILRLFAVLLVLGAIAPTSRSNAARRGQGPEIIRGLVFSHADGRPLRMDLALPRTPGPHPVVVLLHGGAWRRGHRAHLTGTMSAFASAGYAAATVDYRLAAAPRAVFPAPISDARCAVRFLRGERARYGLDPDRVAAVGFSAGAHLSALLATGSDVSGFDDGTCTAGAGSARVQAAVAFYGPYDLRAPHRVGPGADGAIQNFLGVSRHRDPLRAAFASPVTHVDASDPPMLLVHGTRDRIVEVDQSRRMHAALQASGVRVRSLELPRDHGFGIFPRRVGDDTQLADETLAFLSTSLTGR